MQFRTVTSENIDQTAKQLGLSPVDSLLMLFHYVGVHGGMYIIEMNTMQRKVDALTESRRKREQEKWDRRFPDDPPKVIMINSEEYSFGPLTLDDGELKSIAGL